MNRRQLLFLAAAPVLLPSCRSTKKTDTPAPVPVTPPTARFNPGPVPRRLPRGIAVSYSSCAAGGPYAAMTFDDGPHATQTPRLLDMLARWQIRATFFLIGKNAASHPGIVRRMVAEGHEVANHSWSHPALGKMGDAAVREELRRAHDAIASACGVAPITFRPPYGSITPSQKQWIAGEFGYPTIMWSVDPNDWKDRNASVVSSRILSNARPGSIILAHDIHATSVSAMPSTLPVMASRGMRFLTISQLIMRSLGPQALALHGAAPEEFASLNRTLHSPGAF